MTSLFRLFWAIRQNLPLQQLSSFCFYMLWKVYHNRLQEKYPKLKEIFDRQGQNPVFISFLLRTLCFLPGDAVSLYLGATRIPFPYYLTGGVLGTTLGVVLAAILGSSITEPGSPAFWLSASLMALMAIISVIFYLHNIRKKMWISKLCSVTNTVFSPYSVYSQL